MTEQQATTKTARRPYQPPQLEQVQLVVEEAVLQMCKVPRKGGPGPDTCVMGAPEVRCVDPGT